MKLAFRILSLYILFLIQCAISRPQIDLLILGLIIFSLHDSMIYSLILSAWCGILLGLVNPVHFGFHIFTLTLIAFGVNNIRRFIYKYRSYFISIIILALLIKYIIVLIFIGAQQSFWHWLLSVLIILILSIPLENLITRIFYPPSITGTHD
jgi:hypothetical protein